MTFAAVVEGELAFYMFMTSNRSIPVRKYINIKSNYLKNPHFAVKGTLENSTFSPQGFSGDNRPILTPSRPEPCSSVSDSIFLSYDGTYSVKYENACYLDTVKWWQSRFL
jgi:hypothetical protein